jgi:hypothetical protein
MCADILECLLAYLAIHVQSWQIQGNVVVVTLQYLQPEVPCPSCRVAATNLHGRYLRFVQDLPCSGLRLRIIVGLRRVQCRNPASARRTFSVAPPCVNRYSVCQRLGCRRGCPWTLESDYVILLQDVFFPCKWLMISEEPLKNTPPHFLTSYSSSEHNSSNFFVG